MQFQRNFCVNWYGTSRYFIPNNFKGGNQCEKFRILVVQTAKATSNISLRLVSTIGGYANSIIIRRLLWCFDNLVKGDY
jgi:hypothetical protein